MPRMATNEYIGAKRRAYAQANRAKRYANRLLSGEPSVLASVVRGLTNDDIAR